MVEPKSGLTRPVPDFFGDIWRLGSGAPASLILLFLLIPRFWQRGVVVSYYLQNMVEPIAVEPLAPTPVAAPTPTPVIPSTPPETQGA